MFPPAARAQTPQDAHLARSFIPVERLSQARLPVSPPAAAIRLLGSLGGFVQSRSLAKLLTDSGSSALSETSQTSLPLIIQSPPPPPFESSSDSTFSLAYTVENQTSDMPMPAPLPAAIPGSQQARKAGLQEEKKRLFAVIAALFLLIVLWQVVSYQSVAAKFRGPRPVSMEPVHLTLSKEQAERLRARDPLARTRALASGLRTRMSLRASQAAEVD